MIWAKPSLLKAAYAEIENLQRQLEMERGARVCAETVASERAAEVQRATDLASRFEKAYVDSVHERLTSLDSVNVMLMREAAPQAQREEPQGEPQKMEISVERRQSRMSKIRGKEIQNRLKSLAAPKPKEQ